MSKRRQRRQRKQEELLRELYPPVEPQEGEWGWGCISQPAQGTFNFQCGLGTFRLRGGSPQDHWHTPPAQLTVRGRIVVERADQDGVEGLVQILEVIEIISRPLTPEEEREREATIQAYTQGPFAGRLSRPDVFGPNPDLCAPMTDDQWRKILGYDDDSANRVD